MYLSAIASRLTNKSRTTVHRYISNGKLSTCTDENGVKKIETSELLRVFGAFSTVHYEQHVTSNEIEKTKQLEHEVELLIMLKEIGLMLIFHTCDTIDIHVYQNELWRQYACYSLI